MTERARKPLDLDAIRKRSDNYLYSRSTGGSGRFTDDAWNSADDVPALIAEVRRLTEERSERDRAIREVTWDYCLSEIENNEINTEQARAGNPYRSSNG